MDQKLSTILKKSAFTFLFFFFSSSNGSDLTCNPIGQFAYQGLLRENGVIFLRWNTELLFDRAQINTINCSNRKQHLAPAIYQKFQELTASAKPTFVFAKKSGEIAASICLIDVLSVQEFEAQNLEFVEDACAKHGLVRAINRASNTHVYISGLLADYLRNRMPASLTKEKKKTK